MVRREDNLLADAEAPAGHGLQRNPGVVCLWITRSYELFDDGHGKPLITVGPPHDVTWWCEGRAARRAEVEASVESGLPALLVTAKAEGPFAVEALGKYVKRAEQLWPVANESQQEA